MRLIRKASIRGTQQTLSVVGICLPYADIGVFI